MHPLCHLGMKMNVALLFCDGIWAPVEGSQVCVRIHVDVDPSRLIGGEAQGTNEKLLVWSVQARLRPYLDMISSWHNLWPVH